MFDVSTNYQYHDRCISSIINVLAFITHNALLYYSSVPVPHLFPPFSLPGIFMENTHQSKTIYISRIRNIEHPVFLPSLPLSLI